MRGKFEKLARVPLTLVLGGLVAVSLSGCFGDDPTPIPSPPQPVATATAIEAQNNVTPQVPTAEPITVLPSPVLTLAANSSRESDVYRGWPLTLEVTVMHPNYLDSSTTAAPIEIGGDGKPWTGALKLDVVDADGKAQSWPLTLMGAPTGGVTVDGESLSTVYWTLSPEATAKLAEGTYQLTAKLDTANMTAGWKGSVRSQSATLKIEAAPASLSADDQSLLAQTEAAQAVLAGDLDGALKTLNDALAKQPGSIDTLEFKGDVLAEQGKTQEAFDSYSIAMREFFKQFPNPDDMPTTLAEKQHAMMDKLAGNQ